MIPVTHINKESQSDGRHGFLVRDVVRFFLVELIITVSLRLLTTLGLFPNIDAHVLAILAGKVVVFAYIVWLARTRREAWPQTGAATTGKWYAWPLSLAIYAAGFLLLNHADSLNQDLLDRLYRWLGSEYVYQPQIVMILTFENILSTPVRILLVLSIVVVGPFLEELAFRGIALDAYTRAGGPLRAVLWTSLLFGLYHFSFDLLLPLSLLGLIFAAVRLAAKNLWCAFAVHALHNLLALAIMAHNLDFFSESP